MQTLQEDSKLSRTELFELVWQESMRRLAPRFGLSDVGLAKICKKHRVPTPPVGYWTRVAHGIKDERPELPELDDTDLAEIRLFRRHFNEDSDGPEQAKNERIIEVPVSERLVQPHRSVARVKEVLSKRKSDEAGMLPSDESCLNVSVSRSMLPRALRILDAVIKVWEQEGGSVDDSSFRLGKNSVQVNLNEQTRRLLDESNKSSYWNRYKYERTGKLVLEIDGLGGAGLRKTWADGKVQRLENVLGNFIKTLHQWMENLEEHRLEEECRTEQRNVAAARRKQVQEKRRLNKSVASICTRS